MKKIHFFLLIALLLGSCNTNGGSDSMKFPDTLNGDVFRRMQKNGMDFSKEYIFDFEHRFASEADARRMLDECRTLGFKGKVTESYGEGFWDCQINIRMKPVYDRVTEIEERLGKIAVKYNGESDGWGVMY